MEIKILKNINTGLIKETKIGWQFPAKKSFASLRVSAIISAFFLLIGFIERVETATFWNLYTCVAIAYLLLFLATGYGLYKGRIRWLKKANLYIEKRSKTVLCTEYVFSDSILTIRDPEYYSEFKWILFSDYIIYKGFLLIFLSSVDTTNISIELNQLSQTDRSNLLALVAKKVPVRQK